MILPKISLVAFGDGLTQVSGRIRESPVGCNRNLWTHRPQGRNLERGIGEDHNETAYGEYF